MFAVRFFLSGRAVAADIIPPAAPMAKKIFKYTLRAVLGLLLPVVLVVVLLYLPPVQNFVKGKVLSYLATATDYRVSIDRIRLIFPLDVTVDNAVVLLDSGDTLLACKKLVVDVALLPLLRKEVSVRELRLDGTEFNYNDSTAGMDLRASLDRVAFATNRIELGPGVIDVESAELRGGRISLTLGPSLPDTTAADTTSVAWIIRAGKLKFNDIDFRMDTRPQVTRLGAYIGSGTVNNTDIDLGMSAASFESLLVDGGKYSYLVDTAAVAEVAPAATDDHGEESPPWTVRVGSVRLTGNSASYGAIQGNPDRGLDFDHIEVSGLDFSADSIYNRGATVSLDLKQFAFTERCGLRVESLTAKFVMDTASLIVENLRLRTPESSVDADVNAGISLLDMDPRAPVRVRLKADLSLREAMLAAAVEDSSLRSIIEPKRLLIDSDVSGTLASLRADNIVSMPGNIEFALKATARSLLDPDNLDGRAQFDGRLTDLDFLKAFVADTALRSRIGIPGLIAVEGEVAAEHGTYSADLTLRADSGAMKINGSLAAGPESYKADVGLDDFPVSAFLPRDSLGVVSLALKAEGQGFDFFDPRTRAEVSLHVDRADYMGFAHRNIDMAAALAENKLKGLLKARNAALGMNFGIEGLLTEASGKVSLRGTVDSLYLDRMGMTRDEFGGRIDLSLTASADTAGTYTADVALDSLEIWQFGWKKSLLADTRAGLIASRQKVELDVISGDMHMVFNSPVGTDSLIKGFSQTAEAAMQQLDSARFDMEMLTEYLPPYTLRLHASRHNVLNSFMHMSKVAFDSLNVNSFSRPERPFSARMTVQKLVTPAVVLDTLSAGLWQRDQRLVYTLRYRNNRSVRNDVAVAALYGYLAGNEAVLNIMERNKSGEEGFRFGLKAVLQDSTVRVNMFPETPLIANRRWNISPDNYISYTRGNYIGADFALASDDQRLAIHANSEGTRRDVKLDIKNFDISAFLNLIPTAPPVGGALNTDIELSLPGEILGENITAAGTASLAGLKYDGKTVGTPGVSLDYTLTPAAGHGIDAHVLLDGTEIAHLKGTYRPDGATTLRMRAEVPGLPLARVNPFLPEGMATLKGSLQGGIDLAGSFDKLMINGQLRFAEASVGVPMVGTTYGLSDKPLVFSNSKLRLEDYAITASNNSSVNITGNVDMTDFSRIYADLRLRARDFQLLDVARYTNRSMVYGKAYMNLNATCTGLLNNLKMRGSVSLLRGTDVTYTMGDSPLDMNSASHDLVTFVSFDEIDNPLPFQLDTVRSVEIGGMDMQMSINVDDAVKLGVDLSTDGQNRAQLIGGGQLSYTLNPLGDSYFLGRYEASGGTVSYHPPVISAKNFNITDGSFVEWTGNMLDPELNISAVETVRATITPDDGSSAGRAVNFNIIILLKNTLETLEVAFDLAAPNDMAMQNELSSLTAEQRASQAMSLLIYNTYTGPGSTAKVNSSNPLNSFIAKELNQWSRDNLKGVDLSFGIDTYDDGAGGSERTDYSYRLSKSFFNDRVKAVIGGKYSSDADVNQNLAENFVDDIGIEYTLNKRGNMFLTVFRHTDYESILEGEVIETGVGFIIRKKMVRFFDLFKKMQRVMRRESSLSTHPSVAPASETVGADKPLYGPDGKPIQPEGTSEAPAEAVEPLETPENAPAGGEVKPEGQPVVKDE